MSVDWHGSICFFLATLALGVYGATVWWRRFSGSQHFARLFLLLLLLYGACAYYLGHSHNNNILNLAPYLCLVLVGAGFPQLAQFVAERYTPMFRENNAVIWCRRPEKLSFLDEIMPCSVTVAGLSGLETNAEKSYSYRWTIETEPTFTFPGDGRPVVITYRLLSPYLTTPWNLWPTGKLSQHNKFRKVPTRNRLLVTPSPSTLSRHFGGSPRAVRTRLM